MNNLITGKSKTLKQVPLATFAANPGYYLQMVRVDRRNILITDYGQAIGAVVHCSAPPEIPTDQNQEVRTSDFKKSVVLELAKCTKAVAITHRTKIKSLWIPAALVNQIVPEL